MAFPIVLRPKYLTEKNKPEFFKELPNELLLIVLSFLREKEVERLSRTCKNLHGRCMELVGGHKKAPVVAFVKHIGDFMRSHPEQFPTECACWHALEEKINGIDEKKFFFRTPYLSHREEILFQLAELSRSQIRLLQQSQPRMPDLFESQQRENIFAGAQLAKFYREHIQRENSHQVGGDHYSPEAISYALSRGGTVSGERKKLIELSRVHALLRQGNAGRAIPMVRCVESKELPSFGEDLADCVSCLIKDQQFEEACELFGYIRLGRIPRKSDLLLLLCSEMVRAGQFEQALAYIKVWRQDFPNPHSVIKPAVLEAMLKRLLLSSSERELVISHPRLSLGGSVLDRMSSDCVTGDFIDKVLQAIQEMGRPAEQAGSYKRFALSLLLTHNNIEGFAKACSNLAIDQLEPFLKELWAFLSGRGNGGLLEQVIAAFPDYRSVLGASLWNIDLEASFLPTT